MKKAVRWILIGAYVLVAMVGLVFVQVVWDVDETQAAGTEVNFPLAEGERMIIPENFEATLKVLDFGDVPFRFATAEGFKISTTVTRAQYPLELGSVETYQVYEGPAIPGDWILVESGSSVQVYVSSATDLVVKYTLSPLEHIGLAIFMTLLILCVLAVIGWLGNEYLLKRLPR